MNKLFTTTAFAMAALAIGAVTLVFSGGGVASAYGAGPACPADWPVELTQEGQYESDWEHTDGNGVSWVILGSYPLYRAYLASREYDVGYEVTDEEDTCYWNLAKNEFVDVVGGSGEYHFLLRTSPLGPMCPTSWPESLAEEEKWVDNLRHTDDYGDAWVIFGEHPIYRAYLADDDLAVGYVAEAPEETCFWNIARNEQIVMPGWSGEGWFSAAIIGGSDDSVPTVTPADNGGSVTTVTTGNTGGGNDNGGSQTQTPTVQQLIQPPPEPQRQQQQVPIQHPEPQRQSQTQVDRDQEKKIIEARKQWNRVSIQSRKDIRNKVRHEGGCPTGFSKVYSESEERRKNQAKQGVTSHTFFCVEDILLLGPDRPAPPNPTGEAAICYAYQGTEDERRGKKKYTWSRGEWQLLCFFSGGAC